MGSLKMVQRRFGESLRVRLMWDGVLVGIFSGFSSVGYRFMLSKIEHLRHYLYEIDSLNILFVLILFGIMGAFMAALLEWAPLSGGSGIPQIRAELMARASMETGPTIVSKYLGGGMGALAGLSLGREGPSIQIGGATAKWVAQRLKKDPLERNYMITAGASAGLSAAFNAPIAGALFALEEMHKSFSHYLMIPCIVSSVIANYISYSLLGVEPAFSFKVAENLPLNLFPAVFLIGLVTGILGVIFNEGLDKTISLFGKIPLKKTWVLAILLVLTYPLGVAIPDVLGGGHHFVEEMSRGMFTFGPLFGLLIANLIFTWISYGSGAQGGIFLPTLVLGAAGGLCTFHLLRLLFPISQIYSTNFIILGMVGILTAVVRAPILSILLVTEMTGSFSHLIAITLVSFIAYMVAEGCRCEPVYEALYKGLLKKLPNAPEQKHEDFILSAYTLSSTSPVIGYSLEEVDFPTHLMVLSIEREGQEFMPKAEDRFMPGDHIVVFHDRSQKEPVEDFFMAEG